MRCVDGVGYLTVGVNAVPLRRKGVVGVDGLDQQSGLDVWDNAMGTRVVGGGGWATGQRTRLSQAEPVGPSACQHPLLPPRHPTRYLKSYPRAAHRDHIMLLSHPPSHTLPCE